jgi:hypothetical protein
MRALYLAGRICPLKVFVFSPVATFELRNKGGRRSRLFLGDEPKLKSLFHGAEFRDVEITTEAHRFVLPSFEIYFEPFEQGGASTGQALVSLPEETRRAVREQVRRDLRDTGGAIEIEVEYRFGSGRR